MLGRLWWSVGTSAATASVLSTQVAYAAEKNDQTAKNSWTLAPVYDTETKDVSQNLPGTIKAAEPTNNTELAHAESKIASALDVQEMEANGRVFQVSKLLEKYVSHAREFADQVLTKADATTSELSHKYREQEREVARTVADLRCEEEDMLPSAIYVLVAGLGGSVVARRSNFLVRATVPWLFGAGAFAYFLPRTWSNTRQLAWKYEQEQVPTLAKKHEETAKSLVHLKEQSVQFYDDSEQTVKSSVSSLRKTIRNWIGY